MKSPEEALRLNAARRLKRVYYFPENSAEGHLVPYVLPENAFYGHAQMPVL